MGKKQFHSLFGPFIVPTRGPRLRRLIESCRIVFGVLILHRFANIAGMSSLGDNPVLIADQAHLGMLIGLMLISGLFTHYALILLLLRFIISPPFASTLGDQAAALLAWFFLLTGAGRRISLDSLIRQGPLRKLPVRVFYPLVLPISAATYGRIRLFQVALYWGLGVSAMTFHIHDQMWMELKTLHLFYSLPFMTDFYDLFESFRTSSPSLFNLFAKCSLLLQSIWEFALFPLMYFRLGRLFVAFQGLMFFIFSAVSFNLGYLPFYELLWWLLIFGPGLFSALGHLPKTKSLAGLRISRGVGAGFGIIAIGLATTVTFLVGISLKNAGSTEPVQLAGDKILAPMAYYRVFGQCPINVFNRQDLEMGNASAVLIETNSEGKFRRLTPYFDANGARLARLRNDLLYFGYALLWHRESVERKFNPDGSPTDYTQNYIKSLAKLDMCLEGKTSPTSYRAYFTSRQIDETGPYPFWTRPACRSKFEFSITPNEVGDCKGVYFLPPGQWRETVRREKTEQLLVSETEQFNCPAAAKPD